MNIIEQGFWKVVFWAFSTFHPFCSKIPGLRRHNPGPQADKDFSTWIGLCLKAGGCK